MGGIIYVYSLHVTTTFLSHPPTSENSAFSLAGHGRTQNCRKLQKIAEDCRRFCGTYFILPLTTTRQMVEIFPSPAVCVGKRSMTNLLTTRYGRMCKTAPLSSIGPNLRLDYSLCRVLSWHDGIHDRKNVYSVHEDYIPWNNHTLFCVSQSAVCSLHLPLGDSMPIMFRELQNNTHLSPIWWHNKDTGWLP